MMLYRQRLKKVLFTDLRPPLVVYFMILKRFVAYMCIVAAEEARRLAEVKTEVLDSMVSRVEEQFNSAQTIVQDILYNDLLPEVQRQYNKGR